MTKGRRSNEARRNRRLAGRHGGGTQAGNTRAQAVAILAAKKVPTTRVPWWRRVAQRIQRIFTDLEATVAPRRASTKLERQIHAMSQLHQARGTHAQTKQVAQRRQRR